MLELENRLTPTECEQYVTNVSLPSDGSHKCWSGILSDMSHRKDPYDGLSRGRGISDGTLVRWIAAMPNSVEVSHQFEDFYYQHVDSTNSRRMRDNIDVQKSCDWFDSHDPFLLGDTISCISTGYDKHITGSYYILQRTEVPEKNQVMPMRGANCAVKINDKQVPVNPDTIFLKLIFHMKSHEQLSSYFAFELVPYQ
ncbi:hypothetical protein PR048_018226 [Dryococelus australis]|uniref:Uncharacterized protein n=1 Tax=Dryococelus australis TaxID=614101 RepID=A0ABQ9HBX3_9NEOP|nr:hypothetical protein PR048_018226 [Dryococelus australis]